LRIALFARRTAGGGDGLCLLFVLLLCLSVVAALRLLVRLAVRTARRVEILFVVLPLCIAFVVLPLLRRIAVLFLCVFILFCIFLRFVNSVTDVTATPARLRLGDGSRDGAMAGRGRI